LRTTGLHQPARLAAGISLVYGLHRQTGVFLDVFQEGLGLLGLGAKASVDGYWQTGNYQGCPSFLGSLGEFEQSISPAGMHYSADRDGQCAALFSQRQADATVAYV
jgi:hypothetical protein